MKDPHDETIPHWLQTGMPSLTNTELPGQYMFPWDYPWPHQSPLDLWAESRPPTTFALPLTFSPKPPVEHLDLTKYWGAPPAPSGAGAQPPARSFYPSPAPPAPSWDAQPPRATVASAAQMFSQPPTFPPALPLEHLDSGKYWPSGASPQPPAHGFYFSPVPQAPSWDQVPTRPADSAAPSFSQSPSPAPWGASAPPFGAQRDSVERPNARAKAPTEYPVAEEQLVPPKSAPFQDHAQADPFGGFAKPSAGESLANQAEFNECEASQTGTLVPMKGGNYQFCTYGRPALTKQDPDTGHPTGFLVTPGPNGNEVYGRDRITGAWNRWTLAPGQSLTATIDEDGNLQMEIR